MEKLKLQKQKLIIVFLAVFNLIVWSVLAVSLFSKTKTKTISLDRKPKPIRVLATAYGSQKHIFGGLLAKESGKIKKTGKLAVSPSLTGKVAGVQDIFSAPLLAVWLKDKQITASYSNDKGTTWQELTTPLFSEKVENVAGMQDKNGDLHLVYEYQGKIYYRKVESIFGDGVIKPENWLISKAVILDTSGLAHRPSLIVDSLSSLPVVVWSSQSVKGVRETKVNFLRARGDPTLLKNWCNASGNSCGQPAYIVVSGSADELGVVAIHAVFHPLLIQMLQNGDLYLFWSDASKKGREVLRYVVGKKVEGGWDWGEIRNQDELDPETFHNFSLAGVGDSDLNRVAIVYVAKGGKTKVMAWELNGKMLDLSPNQSFGIQFSLAAFEGKYYLFYRKDNGKVSGRQFENSWSEELIESPSEGGYPSVTVEEVEKKLLVVYTNLEGRAAFLSYSLIPPTPTPTAEPTPSEAPALTPTPTTTEPTITPTLSPTSIPTQAPTETPTQVPVEPTATSSPALEPTPTP